VRLKIEVDDEVVFNNYTTNPRTCTDLKPMSTEERLAVLDDASLYQVKLNSYTLPSILIKLIKSTKKNGCVEMTTTRLEKVKTNFKSDIFNQHEVKEGQVVKFTVTLVGHETTRYFYKYPVATKLAVVKRLKGIAGDFFKLGNYAKAAKIY
jgi:hypothetical protein